MLRNGMRLFILERYGSDPVGMPDAPSTAA
jgi:hypothetical protein